MKPRKKQLAGTSAICEASIHLTGRCWLGHPLVAGWWTWTTEKALQSFQKSFLLNQELTYCLTQLRLGLRDVLSKDLGALKPPIALYDRAAFWIIDHHKFALSVLVKRNVPLASILTFPFGAFLSAVSWVRNSGRCRPNRHTYITEVTTIDERFDRYWEKLRAQPNRLLCVRDRAAMAWRFERPMRAGNASSFVYYGSPIELAGYAAG